VKVIGNLTKDAIIRAAVSEGLTIAQSVGSGVVYEQANASSTSVVYDTANDKIVVGYRDGGDSNYGKAVVGTVSGDSISFGSPVTFYNTSAINKLQTVFDTNAGKIVFAFEGNSGYGIAIVGTVSGTSISFGSTTDFLTAQVSNIGLAYDSTNSKVVVCCRNGGNSNSGNARVGTVSGTSISFGTDVTYNSGSSTNENQIVYDTNAQKMVVAFRDIGNSSYGTAIVGTVSGTDISFGSEVVFNSANSNNFGISYDPIAQKVLIAYMDEGNNYYGTAIVGTVSGTSISFGSSAVFAENNTANSQIAYDANAQRHVIVYRNQTTNPYSGFLIPATVSGTSVSFGTATSFTSTSFSEPDVAYDPDQKKVVLAYSDANNSSYGTARVFTTGYTQATGGTIADGSAVIVNANGTVSTISQSSVSENLGSEVALPVTGNGSNNWAMHMGGTYDSVNGKVIITYVDYYQTQKGFALVGTVSGYTVTWGTPVEFEAGRTQWTSAAFDSVNGKVVISYKDMDNSNYGKTIVGTVSGNSISFGTPVVFQSAESTYIDTTYDASAGAIVVNYAAASSGKVIAGTVSGTSITFGSAVQFGNSGLYGRAVYHPEEECTIIAWRDSSPTQGEARALTVSGTTITLGTAVAYQAGGQANQNDIAYDADSKKIVIIARDEVNTTYGSSYVGTVSGTTLTFASPVTFQTGSIDWMGIEGWYTGGVAMTYDNQGDGGSTKITFRFGTISGTTITWGSKTNLYDGTGNNGYTGWAMDTANNRLVMTYNANYIPKYRVYNPAYTTTSLTTENFVGFMDGAALDGTNGEILSSCSIARNQTSLTPGQTYFVSPTDGSLSTSAGSPSVTAGTAISSTEIIVKG